MTTVFEIGGKNAATSPIGCRGTLHHVMIRGIEKRRIVKDQIIDKLISKLCESARVSIKELKSGNRRKEVSSVRYLIAVGLVRNHGVSFAEVARRVGVSTTAEGKRGIFEFDIFLIWIRIRS
jgi:hypothetical protein